MAAFAAIPHIAEQLTKEQILERVQVPNVQSLVVLILLLILFKDKSMEQRM